MAGENKEGIEQGGTLLDINLTDILQVLSVNRKTCTLFLRKDDEGGEIYLRDGKIIDASIRELKGEEALFYLLDWGGADFFIGTSGEGGMQTRIEKDLHVLILDWIEKRNRHKNETEVKPVIEEKAKEISEKKDDNLIFLKKMEAAGVIKAIN